MFPITPFTNYGSGHQPSMQSVTAEMRRQRRDGQATVWKGSNRLIEFAKMKERDMQPIKFSKDETKAIVDRIRDWFLDERDEDLGQIPAEMVLNFFAEEIGGYFYNRGLYDAQALVAKRTDDLTDEIYGLEQPTRARPNS